MQHGTCDVPTLGDGCDPLAGRTPSGVPDGRTPPDDADGGLARWIATCAVAVLAALGWLFSLTGPAANV